MPREETARAKVWRSDGGGWSKRKRSQAQGERTWTNQPVKKLRKISFDRWSGAG